VLVAGVAALHRLVYSDFGRLLVAVRDNEQRARLRQLSAMTRL